MSKTLGEKILELRLQNKSYKQICSVLGCSKSTVSLYCQKNNINNIGLGIVESEFRICLKCKNKFKVKRDQPKQRYCCRKCADTSNSKKVLGRKNGLKSVSVQANKKQSKNEISFLNLCKNHFSNVSSNELLFNGWDADVIIHDFKIAVLWNGKWHYEQITKKHSVKQVQNRDKIKITEIIKAGYIPYIIKDMGREDKEFVSEKFEELCRYIPSLS
jgi:hypothetical protein